MQRGLIAMASGSTATECIRRFGRRAHSCPSSVKTGNLQVYAWNRYHMNTLPIVTCALIALEKWLDERITAKKGIADIVDLLWQNGRSLAFAGVLISIGKRHRQHFL